METIKAYITNPVFCENISEFVSGVEVEGVDDLGVGGAQRLQELVHDGGRELRKRYGVLQKNN